ncbi:hypothetical protein B0O99DRAFT_384751 [Bisporella sp. PMI_857]|nr:hypothetical protein B0O99DRAFT_384751 [Bisporella sp. PMI_857]
MYNSTLLTLSLFLFTLVHATKSQNQIPWSPCDKEINSTLPSECGNLYVPLDYTDLIYGETLKLELLKIPALVQPSKGSILLNFGGPGFIARSTLAILAPILQILSGGVYDLIAFDPRGTGNTLPFDCKLNDIEVFQALKEQSRWPINADDQTTARIWAQATIEASACHQRANLTGSLISTAFVARDLISVVDALDEDGMLRYWGFSYGSTLGATVAAMFPERIDRMVLDGIQNPHEYYNALSDFEEWTDSDKLFSQIFVGCVASPMACALAYRNQTAAQLEAAVWDAIDALYLRPIVVGNIIVDYTLVMAMIAQSFYDPGTFPELASVLELLLSGNTSNPLLEASLSAFLSLNWESLKESVPAGFPIKGIHCGDNRARVDTLDEYLPSAEKLHNISRVMGAASKPLSMACVQWKIEPKERYTGDFNVKTKNPMLIIGNTWDGHTPLVSAKNVSAGFEGSEVLEVRGWGHTSLVNPSLCAIRITTQYWLTGTLPAPGTVCKVDSPLFSNVTWADVLLGAADNGISSLSKRIVDVPALHTVGRGIPLRR